MFEILHVLEVDFLPNHLKSYLFTSQWNKKVNLWSHVMVVETYGPRFVQGQRWINRKPKLCDFTLIRCWHWCKVTSEHVYLLIYFATVLLGFISMWRVLIASRCVYWCTDTQQDFSETIWSPSLRRESKKPQRGITDHFLFRKEQLPQIALRCHRQSGDEAWTHPGKVSIKGHTLNLWGVCVCVCACVQTIASTYLSSHSNTFSNYILEGYGFV